MVLLAGCGTGGDLQLDSLPPGDTNDITVKGGKDGINVIHGTDATSGRPTVRYLGEIENNAKQPSCYISITFSTLGPDGKPIDQGLARSDLNGFTLTNFGDEIHTCIKPGQFGSFDTGNILLSNVFSDFQFKRCFISNNNTELCQFFPFASEPRIPLVVAELIPGEIAGMKTYTVRIKNDSTEQNDFAYDVTIHFTVLNNQGKVIGTATSDLVESQPCPGNIKAQTPLGCIGPGILTNPITVDTKTAASEVCDGCFYYRVHHSE